MKRLLQSFALVLFVAAGGSALLAQGENQRDRDLTVMTRNMDAGSDFGYILAAALNPNTTQAEFLGAITKTFGEMYASNYAARADRVAAEIEAAQPYLVGLQEVTTLRTGAYPGHATTVVTDQLQSLLAALEKRGLHYAALKVQKNADIEEPAFDAYYNVIMVGFADYDVVLVRTDLPVSQLKIEGVQGKYFEAILGFPIGGQSIPFTRGWIAVDAKLRGKNYRFVTTHLETFVNEYQAAQTQELLAGPLNTYVPTILAGDLNSDAHAPSFANGPAFGMLVNAGFADIWSELHPADAGLTWPNFPEDEKFPTVTPFQRIDLILTRGSGIAAEAEQLVGTAPVGGVWASDHVGVVATLKLLP
ncbi:endonuclease/exonuclease/phosphatase family protein [Occallatibacter savannae]|uniref:endonuclease/exonuclease/phosphatase family protein n=1 Tax=Occallatibacter savannae TaxID=1002691 RepID=UPI0013A568D9|nr:endonuclease/exonuclease/phosphatase family protein [Occallatibacter savannae]